MTLAELIAAKRATGGATPEAAHRLGIPVHSVEWMASAPLVTNGRPWRPMPDIVAKIAAWLVEDATTIERAIRDSHKEGTRA